MNTLGIEIQDAVLDRWREPCDGPTLAEELVEAQEQADRLWDDEGDHSDLPPWLTREQAMQQVGARIERLMILTEEE